MSIAPVAETGFASSSEYDAYRPSYPPEAVERLIQLLEIEGQDGVKVLDLAAGTGKFTQLLASRPESYEIVAVEPHDGMRKELESKKFKNVAVRKGTAENMEGVAEQEFAAAVVAHAFHWMSNMQALKEIHRVLKPTAVLGLIWNIEDYLAPKDWQIHEGWHSTMWNVMDELKDDQPRYRDQQWKKVFDEQGSSNPLSLHASDPLFGLPVGEESFDFVRWVAKESVWKMFKTYSQIANLDTDRLGKVEKTFWEAIDSPQTELDDQGRVAIHGKTVIAWTSSIPDGPLKSGG
ncbi:hypothetical protein LTR70_000741 [Exophiala xenobiotica]|uniref:Methyltransferase type 11 domain-containing protein n=1 Tax=Lithohypha guttulata TaxID=1690604 RepID=A0ABR0KNL3_9EURO|nr:hypothetical protein LTR24_000587 [Lithohypha guttulata]KAK5329244.1 hypothetical protein LTR70_000741 [Exophiala xenobiotica]